jgi:hypothetical protein
LAGHRFYKTGFCKAATWENCPCGVGSGVYLAQRELALKIDGITWYIAFGRYELAVIAQTIHARCRQGLTVGPNSKPPATPSPTSSPRRRLSS